MSDDKPSPFSGIHRTVSTEPLKRWDDPIEPFTVADLHAVTKRMISAPRYRAPLYPPGWTMTELGPLPPGWSVVDGKPVRPASIEPELQCDCGATPDPSESPGTGMFFEDGRRQFICFGCWRDYNFGTSRS